MRVKNVQLKLSGFQDVKKVLVANIPLFAIIAFIIFVTFINGVNGEFVSDDIPGIVREPRVHNFNQAIKVDIQMIIYSILWNTFGENEVPFHINSMIGHFYVVILFFLVAYNLFGKKVAALATILYSVHPVVAEVVLWISAFNYVITTSSTYIIITLYLIYRKNNDRRWLTASVVAFIVLVFTFSSFWSLLPPFIILGIEMFLLGEKSFKKELKALIPFFVIVLMGFFYRTSTGVLSQRVGSLETPDATPFLNRLPFTFYMPWNLFVWPKELTIYHEGQIIGKVKYAIMAAVSFLTVFGSLFMLQKPKFRVYGALLALIFISTLPVFSPIQVAWFVAERYLYISVAFFCVLITILLFDLEKVLRKKNLATILSVILILAAAGRSFVRTYDWKTRKTLWESTAKIGPYSPRVHNNLGDVYGLEQNWDKAIGHFKIAIQLKPDFYYAMHNLGNNYMKMGRYDLAEPWLRKSLELYPGLHQSIHKLGIIAYSRGEIEEAKAYMQKTLEVDPTYLPAIEALQILQQRNP